MSHSTKITLIADQEITLLGEEVNIHDLERITLGSQGEVRSYSIQEEISKEILEDIMEAKRFIGTPGIHQAIPRDLMIRIDSLLSCLIHRHGSVLDQINEAEEVKELAPIVQKYTR